MKTKLLTVLYLAFCPILIVLGAIINAIIHAVAYVIDSVYHLCHLTTSYRLIKSVFDIINDEDYIEANNRYRKAFMDFYPLMQTSLTKKIYDYQKDTMEMIDQEYFDQLTADLFDENGNALWQNIEQQ